VFALIVVLAVGALAAGYAEITSAVTRREGRAVDTKQAFYLAEAGLAESFAGLMVGKDGDVGSPTEPAAFGNGLFWVDSTEDVDGFVHLESTAMQGGGRAHLALTLEKGGFDFGRLGLFSAGDMNVPAGAFIDGYDSRKGSYASQAAARVVVTDLVITTVHTTSQLAEVGANGNIVVTQTGLTPTEVYANGHVGPTGALIRSGRPVLQGTLEHRAESVSLPAVVLPSIPTEAGVTKEDGLSLVVPPGDSSYEYLHTSAGSTVVLQGPARVVVDDLQLLDSSNLVFDTSLGPVELYVDGPLNLEAGSHVVMTGNSPADVRVFATGTDPVTLEATSSFRGMVYAPNADASVGSSFELFGSISAQNLNLAAGAKLHFDHYLSLVGAKIGLPCGITWRIVSLDSPVPGGAAGVDPFLFLGVDRSTCPTPADAHPSGNIEITYVDTSNVTRTYSGPESAFDWSQVSRVVDGARNGTSLLSVLNYILSFQVHD